MTKKMLDRRTLLRGGFAGAALSVALPPLEIMLNAHGTAYAAGQPFPKRFGVWFWAGGTGAPYKHPRWDMSFWAPATDGKAWVPSPLLAPLAKVKDYVSVVSGMDLAMNGSVHHAQRAVALSATYQSGVPDLYSASFGGVQAPSIDQVVAEAWKGRTALPSLEVGVSRKGPFLNTVSFKGPKQRLPSESNPKAVFDRLFANATGGTGGAAGGGSAATAALLKVQKSVLDVVSGDVTRLKANLGAVDRARLEAHLQGIRDIEKQLVPPAPISCAAPAAPASLSGGDVNREDLEGRHRIMSDLIALALACDITRVFSVEFTPMQAYTIFWQVGVQTEHHDLTHIDGARADVRKTIVYTLQQLAYLLEKLKSTPVGAGNMLDHLGLYATTESADASMHSIKDHPMLVIGKAGGALNAGVHHRAPTGDNAAKVLLTLARAMDVPLPEIGRGAARTTDVVPGLLA